MNLNVVVHIEVRSWLGLMQGDLEVTGEAVIGEEVETELMFGTILFSEFFRNVVAVLEVASAAAVSDLHVVLGVIFVTNDLNGVCCHAFLNLINSPISFQRGFGVLGFWGFGYYDYFLHRLKS